MQHKVIMFPQELLYDTPFQKLLSSDKEHFEISLSYRCVTCDVILYNNDSTGTCKPCLKAAQAIKKSTRRKTQSLSAPAKKKAPLAACGADKLRATVKAQRLECKQLEARLDQLQTEIKKDGIGEGHSHNNGRSKPGGNTSYEIFLVAADEIAANQKNGQTVSPPSYYHFMGNLPQLTEN